MEASKIAPLVSRYLATFGRRPDAEIVKAYALTLSDLTAEQVAAAFLAAARKPTEHPLSAGQLFALGATGGKNADVLADEAFDLVSLTVYSAEYPIDFADKRINAAIRSLGGLTRLASLSEDDLQVWYRKSFVASYKRFLEHPPSPEAASPLQGTLASSHVMWDGRTLGETGPLMIAWGAEGQPVSRLPRPGEYEPPKSIGAEFGLKLKTADEQGATP